MPEALLIIDYITQYDEEHIVTKMVKIGLIKRVLVKGVRVYGRPYLTNRAIREAYKKKVKNES